MKVNSINNQTSNNLNNSSYTQMLALWEQMKALETKAANDPRDAHELFEQMGQIASEMQSVAKQMPSSQKPLFEQLTDAISDDIEKFKNSFNGTSDISRAYEFGSFDSSMQGLFQATVDG